MDEFVYLMITLGQDMRTRRRTSECGIGFYKPVQTIKTALTSFKVDFFSTKFLEPDSHNCPRNQNGGQSVYIN